MRSFSSLLLFSFRFSYAEHHNFSCHTLTFCSGFEITYLISNSLEEFGINAKFWLGLLCLSFVSFFCFVFFDNSILRAL